MNDKPKTENKGSADGELAEYAKELLIVKRGMSEQQAHKFLQKQAMDKCVTKSVIAAAVINELE
ncbi:MAG: ANTAR domain-containing protein [Ruminococcus sp.]|nr:ANTAR domain-containing protein [Ruminococcus sp.]